MGVSREEPWLAAVPPGWASVGGEEARGRGLVDSKGPQPSFTQNTLL